MLDKKPPWDVDVSFECCAAWYILARTMYSPLGVEEGMCDGPVIHSMRQEVNDIAASNRGYATEAHGLLDIP